MRLTRRAVFIAVAAIPAMPIHAAPRTLRWVCEREWAVPREDAVAWMATLAAVAVAHLLVIRELHAERAQRQHGPRWQTA